MSREMVVKWVTTFGMLTMLAFAGFMATTYTTTVGDLTWSYTLDGDGNVTVTSVVPVPCAMVIPDRLGGRSVTAIGDFAFEYCGQERGQTPDRNGDDRNGDRPPTGVREV